jgi:mRNA-degrading endonuclease RelE of RelBE toxin-antitoxin system
MRRLNASAKRPPCMQRGGLRLYSKLSSAWIIFLPGARSSQKRKQLGYPARHLLYGKEKGMYRIIFDILEAEQHVRVLRVWHASRHAISAADVEY